MAAPISKVTYQYSCNLVTNRFFNTSSRLEKIIPGKLKGTQSSREWVTRQLNDKYVKLAREENWRCRSAFKLLQIDDRFKILQPGGIVIDCGAAPGSWSQVAAQRIRRKSKNSGEYTKGVVIAVDLQDFEPLDGVTIFPKSDFTKPETQSKLLRVLDYRLANAVLSDMAPRSSGNKDLDHQVIAELCMSVLKFSSQVLDSRGHVVCKLWDGREKSQIVNVMNRMFETVKTVKPESSRADSAEIFLVGLNYKLKKK